jgi:hypothetical protein
MRYKNRGSMTEIGVEDVAGHKKIALTIRYMGKSEIVGYFSNEQKARDFEEAFRRFIRGAVIDDRDARGRAI